MRSFDDRDRSGGRTLIGGGLAPVPSSAPPPSLPLPPDPPHLSPSLRADRDGAAAFEVKFLLPDDLAREVERRVAAAARLALDPHTDPTLGNAYRTTTLYFDTPAFDVFHGSGVGKRKKHRVRRYGAADFVFLERKSKKGTEVAKKRSAVPVEELVALADPPADPVADPESGWAGEWFRRLVAKHALRPVCWVTYDRTAYSGTTPDGPLRLTFDRGLRGAMASGWAVDAVTAGPDLLGGLVIVEFKFQAALPAAGKRVVEDLRLEPGAASKYRRYLTSTGMARVRPEPPAPEAPAPGGAA